MMGFVTQAPGATGGVAAFRALVWGWPISRGIRVCFEGMGPSGHMVQVLCPTRPLLLRFGIKAGRLLTGRLLIRVFCKLLG